MPLFSINLMVLNIVDELSSSAISREMLFVLTNQGYVIRKKATKQFLDWAMVPVIPELVACCSTKDLI